MGMAWETDAWEGNGDYWAQEEKSNSTKEKNEMKKKRKAEKDAEDDRGE